MAYVTYTAVDRGSLVGGHTAGNSYDLEFDAEAIDRSVKRENSKHIAMSGKQETLRIRKDVFWRVTSDLITHANMVYWYEFLDSVDAGETFIFDPYGTVAVPDNPTNVKLDGDPTEPRNNSTMTYHVTFKAREV